MGSSWTSLRCGSAWVAAALLGVSGCSSAASAVDCRVAPGAAVVGVRDGGDLALPAIDAVLTPVARGCGAVVDVQFVPGSADRAIVLDQDGVVSWIDLAAGTSGRWFAVEPVRGGEQGLLGAAFHPDFAENGRVLFQWIDRGPRSRVASFRADPRDPFAAAPVEEHVVLTLKQPFPNHNGGGLVFGPDGMLYIGYGDGGSGGDPHGNGQDGSTWLGAMLRIDVDVAPYRVPPDNPFVGKAGYAPEVWAIGLRNPWRYGFDPSGRLIVADVGQNAWEEVGFVPAGSNAGWNAREGRHCYQPGTGCRTEGLVEPFWEYSHAEGQSVTGGYVAGAPPALAGRYVLGDFGSGRIWAIALPEGTGAAQVAAVGRFPVQIATFGRDAAGRIYVGGYRDGVVYRLDAAGG